MKKAYYVYIYINPINDIPFYVGKGKQWRYVEHLNLANSKKNKRKYKPSAVMKEIWRIQETYGVDPKIIIHTSDLSSSEALNLERKLIAEYGRVDLSTGCLVNKTAGGQAGDGWVITEAFRQQRREIQKRIWEDPEYRARQKESHRGKTRSQEAMQKTIETHKENKEWVMCSKRQTRREEFCAILEKCLTQHQIAALKLRPYRELVCRDISEETRKKIGNANKGKLKGEKSIWYNKKIPQDVLIKRKETREAKQKLKELGIVPTE